MAVSYKQRHEEQEPTHRLPATPPPGPNWCQRGGGEGGVRGPIRHPAVQQGGGEGINVQRCAEVARQQTVAAWSLQRSV